jgi:hypothetical protein
MGGVLTKFQKVEPKSANLYAQPVGEDCQQNSGQEIKAESDGGANKAEFANNTNSQVSETAMPETSTLDLYASSSHFLWEAGNNKKGWIFPDDPTHWTEREKLTREADEKGERWKWSCAGDCCA